MSSRRCSSCDAFSEMASLGRIPARFPEFGDLRNDARGRDGDASRRQANAFGRSEGASPSGRFLGSGGALPCPSSPRSGGFSVRCLFSRDKELDPRSPRPSGSARDPYRGKAELAIDGAADLAGNADGVPASSGMRLSRPFGHLPVEADNDACHRANRRRETFRQPRSVARLQSCRQSRNLRQTRHLSLVQSLVYLAGAE